MFLKLKGSEIKIEAPKIELRRAESIFFSVTLFSSSIVVWTEFTFEDTTNTPNEKF